MSKAARKKKPVVTKESGGMSVLATFAIAAGLLVGYHLLLAPENVARANHAGPAHSIMVVDSKAVLQAFMDEKENEIAAGGNFTEGEIRLSGAEFAAEYMRAIKKYRDKGYLIIDKKYALGVPAESEITQQIGDALQLDVVVGVDPFSAPELE